MKRYLLIFTVIIIFTISLPLTAADNIYKEVDEHNNLRLGNDYIVIIVNQDKNARGRFAIETTGGAPFRENDDYLRDAATAIFHHQISENIDLTYLGRYHDLKAYRPKTT